MEQDGTSVLDDHVLDDHVLENREFDNHDNAGVQADSGRPEVVLRLKRIEGQIRGVQHMVESRRECGDVLTQLLAIRSSLDQVALQVFNGQIEQCLNPASLDADTRRALQESIKLWTKLK